MGHLAGPRSGSYVYDVSGAPRGRGAPAALTSLVGRESELGTLAALLEDGIRLVSVVGPGGIGKTRIAAEHARRAIGRSVTWVGLSAAVDVGDMLREVAMSLALTGDALHDPNAIAESLARSPETLLVLDNLEQLLPHVADVVREWLEAAPRLAILATSRTRLGVGGEAVLGLGPLDTSAARGISAPPSPGLELFLDRARRENPLLAWDAEALEQAHQIVERLEGIPLAIELAASRYPLVGMDRLVDALEDRSLEALGSDRSLDEVLVRSWQLLAPAETEALGRLTVFRGEFDMTSATYVLAARAESDAEEIVERLLRKSLIRPARAAGRFAMYRAIAEVAAARAPREAVEDARVRHAALYRGRALAGNLGELDRFEIEGIAMRSAAPDLGFWLCRIHALGSRSRIVSRALGPTLERALEPSSAALSALERATTLVMLARLHWQEGRAGETERSAREAVEVLERSAVAGLEHAGVEIEARSIRAVALVYLDRISEASAVMSRITGVSPRGDHVAASAYACAVRSTLAVARGDHEEAHRQATLATALARAHRLPWVECFAGLAQAMVFLDVDAASEALALLESIRDLATREGLLRYESLTWAYSGLALLHLSRHASSREHLERAVQLERRLRNQHHEAFARGIRAAAYATGDLVEEATHDLETARRLVDGDPISLACLRVCEGHIHLARMRRALEEGETARARRELEAAQDSLECTCLDPHAAPREVAKRSDDARVLLRLLERALAAVPRLGARVPRERSRRSLLVSPQGAWMRVDYGEPIPLERKPVLRGLLLCLAHEALRSGGGWCSRDALFQAGWPESRLSPSTLRNRLNVALNALRRQGLGEMLEYSQGSYRIRPTTHVMLA